LAVPVALLEKLARELVSRHVRGELGIGSEVGGLRLVWLAERGGCAAGALARFYSDFPSSLYLFEIREEREGGAPRYRVRIANFNRRNLVNVVV